MRKLKDIAAGIAQIPGQIIDEFREADRSYTQSIAVRDVRLEAERRLANLVEGRVRQIETNVAGLKGIPLAQSGISREAITNPEIRHLMVTSRQPASYWVEHITKVAKTYGYIVEAAVTKMPGGEVLQSFRVGVAGVKFPVRGLGTAEIDLDALSA